MRQLKAKIIENKQVGQSFYRMCVESSYLASNAKPGQFLEIRCSEGTEPLLRRPLGIHRIMPGLIEILYQVIGAGTGLLSMKEPGEELDIIGPLGNGFSIDRRPQTADRRPVVLIAGGIGVAPLVALAEGLVHGPRSKVRGKSVNMYVLIGACKKAHILCEVDFKKLGAKVMVATEDGSKGRKGLISEALGDLLSTIDSQPSTVYACGPAGMLKAVSQIAKKYKTRCQVSLEEKMACGVGVCLGCPVKVRNVHSPQSTVHGYEYKMVCKDGPVFDAEEIIW